MRRSVLGAIALAVLAAAPVQADVPVSLRGSLSAMERQHGVALELGLPFAQTPNDMARLEAQGELVRLRGNDDYGFREGVGSMVARPEMETFIERLAADYRAACGERLIVTSLTRPLSRQPRNAHRLSVHPAGIAVDLRVSRSAACRQWLEDALLDMEDAGLVDVTREWSPPHYHVALFPDAYMSVVGPVIAAEREREVRQRQAQALLASSPMFAIAGAPPEEGGRDWGALVVLPLLAVGGLVLHRRGVRLFE